MRVLFALTGSQPKPIASQPGTMISDDRKLVICKRSRLITSFRAEKNNRKTESKAMPRKRLFIPDKRMADAK